MNIDMLVFGEDWGQHPSSTQHLIRHLMPDQQIVWVNSIGLRRPQLTINDLKRIGVKLGQFFNQRKLASSSVDTQQPLLINPLTIPLPGSYLARWCNQKILKATLSGAMKGKVAKRPLLWTSLPSAVDVVGKLGERAAVYYCGDDFSALDGVDHTPISKMETELASKCNLIITASDKLAQKFPDHKTIVLPHGVDFDLFSTPSDPATDLPSGPVAGFYGAIAGWFDKALIIRTARLLPHWNFVLIGPIKTQVEDLAAEPNIHLYGPRSHNELPAYSQHWNISILPFKRNKQIEACNPLKLREYLAAGSSVVSTDYPALDGYRDLITVANDAVSFAKAIDDCHIKRESENIFRSSRQQRVMQESWSNRADYLKNILNVL